MLFDTIVFTSTGSAFSIYLILYIATGFSFPLETISRRILVTSSALGFFVVFVLHVVGLVAYSTLIYNEVSPAMFLLHLTSTIVGTGLLTPIFFVPVDSFETSHTLLAYIAILFLSISMLLKFPRDDTKTIAKINGGQLFVVVASGIAILINFETVGSVEFFFGIAVLLDKVIKTIALRNR